MPLNLVVGQQRRPPQLLLADELPQLAVRHRLADRDVLVEVQRRDVERRVELLAPENQLFVVGRDDPSHVAVQSPGFVIFVIINCLCRNLQPQGTVVELLVGEVVSDALHLVPPLHENVAVFRVLDVQVTRGGRPPPEILELEVVELPVGRGDDEVGHDQREQHDDDGSYHVGHQHPVETDAVVEDGDDLVARRELRGEPDHADEGEQRNEEVDEIGDEVEVVTRNHLFGRHIVAHKPLDILRHVEHDDNGHQQGDGEHHRAQHLPEQIAVDNLPTDLLPKPLAEVLYAV